LRRRDELISRRGGKSIHRAGATPAKQTV